MQRVLFLILSGVLLFMVAACTAPSVSTQAMPSVPPPKEGSATLAGQIVARSDRSPIEKVLVQLAGVYDGADGKQAFALDLANAPGAVTDAQGYFAIPDVKPGKYVMVVGDYYGVNEIVSESNGDARVYDAQSGELLNAGVLQVKPDVTTAP